MAFITVSETPGASTVGTAEDDFFLISSAAWLAADRAIDGRGGRDTLIFQWGGASTQALAVLLAVPDTSFAGVSNVEVIQWSPDRSDTAFPFFAVTMGAVASAAFPQGVTVSALLSLLGQDLTVPVTYQGGFSLNPCSVLTGSGNDLISGEFSGSRIDAGAGDDLISIGPLSSDPFAGVGSVAGGPGYDILIWSSFPGATFTAGANSGVTGIEEIRSVGRLNLLDTTPTALTGLDSSGTRNPLVLRPANAQVVSNLSFLSVYASDDGRASYDGRIVAYGDARADTVRGSSVADWLDGGSGGADSLSGEGGNDILVLQNADHLAAAALIGGGAGYDILALQSVSETLTDAAFARASGLEEVYFLGAGTQRVTFGANSDAAFAASSFGAGSVSAVYASSLIVDASGSNRALSIYGSNGADTLTGGAGADYIESRAGADVIDAGAGNDHIHYDARPDSAAKLPGSADKVGPSVDGGAGYDVALLQSTGVFGRSIAIDTWRNIEELRLVGTGGLTISVNQAMFEGSITGYGTVSALNASSLFLDYDGSVTIGLSIYGSPGDDVIYSGNGRDYVVGGAGADRLIFLAGRNVDVFADFTSGTDKIWLPGFSDVQDFAAVQARSAVVDGNIQIRLNANDAIILAGVTSVAAGDFIFS